MGKLTAAKVKALDKPGRYSDGDCLLLNVAPGGSKSWIARVRQNGKRRDIGLGSASLFSLAEARERAYEAVGKISFEGMQYRTDIARAAAGEA